MRGERSNWGLWRYIAGLDVSVAWPVAAACPNAESVGPLVH